MTAARPAGGSRRSRARSRRGSAAIRRSRRAGPLVEHGDAERDRDDRRDVGDHGGAAGADLADQRGEQDERSRGAEAAPSTTMARSPRRRRRRRRRGAPRPVARMTAASASAPHHRARIEVGWCGEQHRPAGVADGRDEDRRRAEQLAARCRRRRCRRARRPRRSRSAGRRAGCPARSHGSKRIASTAMISGTAAIRIAATTRRRAARRPRSAGTGSRSRHRVGERAAPAAAQRAEQAGAPATRTGRARRG